MPGESLSFSITADDRASPKFRDVGRSALDASAKLDIAAASLKLWDDTAAKQGKAATTSINAMKAHAAATKLLADAENVLAGKATVTTKLLADQGRALDDTAKKAASAAGKSGLGALTGGGGLQGGGMGAVIAAGVALSPIIATVGTGLLGLGAAAYGIAKPIEKAAQAAGGLQANMAKLNPEQQAVAQGLLNLGKTFASFQSGLEPVVLSDFDQGLKLAATLLHDVEPVAAATGKALGGVVGEISANFQSGTWQQFFAFMARTAGPDVQLLGRTFIDLTNTLPPLLEQLQPVATDLLAITDGAAKLTAWLARSNQSLDATGQHMNTLQHITSTLRTVLFSPGAGLLAVLKLVGLTGGAAGKGLQATALGALKAQPPVFDLSKAVAILNTDMTALVGNLLTLQGDELSWKQSLQAAEAQLKSNTAGLEGNSKNALANKQAVLQSTQAALTFASQQLALNKNIAGATTTIQTQIKWLQGLHDKSSLVRQEIAALRAEEAKLEAQRVRQIITVDASGTWAVVQGGGGRLFSGRAAAAGWLVSGGTPGKDSVPIMAMPGETVVPKHLTPAVAPLMKAHGVPGFAQGGIVPSYSGGVSGVWPWVKGNDAATIRLIDQAVAKAAVAGIRAAAGAPGALGGPTSASAAQAQAYARSRLSAYGWGGGEMPPLIALWNQESGWNRLARNPTSGAYGIPQALPPGKMGAAANPPTSSAAAQINWGLGYIKSSYGSPSAAEDHELAVGWYDRGGALRPGWNLAYNGTGRAEMVVPSRGTGRVVPAASRRARAGPLVHVAQMVVQDATDAHLVAQRLSFAVVAAGLGS